MKFRIAGLLKNSKSESSDLLLSESYSSCYLSLFTEIAEVSERSLLFSLIVVVVVKRFIFLYLFAVVPLWISSSCCLCLDRLSLSFYYCFSIYKFWKRKFMRENACFQILCIRLFLSVLDLTTSVTLPKVSCLYTIGVMLELWF